MNKSAVRTIQKLDLGQEIKNGNHLFLKLDRGQVLEQQRLRKISFAEIPFLRKGGHSRCQPTP